MAVQMQQPEQQDQERERSKRSEQTGDWAAGSSIGLEVAPYQADRSQPYQSERAYQPYLAQTTPGGPSPTDNATLAGWTGSAGDQDAVVVPARRRARSWWKVAIAAMALLAVLAVGAGIGGSVVGAGLVTSHLASSSASPASAASSSQATQALQQTLIATAHAVEPSMVEITGANGTQEVIGSGEILTKDGYIVTNDHVVSGFSSFAVRLSDGQSFAARLVGQDPQDDLAVLKAPLTNAQPITFANSDTVQVGAFAIALGSPLGLADSLTFGIVSALNRTASESPTGPADLLAGLIQTSAPINPGNSGGALVDLDGHLIGIPTLSAIDSETGAAANGIGFAIPANRVQYVTQQLIANGRLTSSGQGYLGIQCRDVSGIQGGVQIVAFASDASGQSPARAAGLQIGDVIVAVDGHAVASGDELASAVMTKTPGTQVTLQIIRGSTQSTVRVTLGERPLQAQG